MGKIEGEFNVMIHFSHSHPLTLKSINSSPPNTSKCSACQRGASGLVYNCEPCGYSLHKICSEMPEEFTHRVDRKHALTLLSAPAYSDGLFQCNACGVAGTTGFCYHCQECEIDLNPACAFTRSSVNGGAHDHPLQLFFEPPYENKAFICDFRGGSGSNHWLYRCEPCGFDAHLKCAKAGNKVQTSSRTTRNVDAQMFQQLQGGTGRMISHHSSVYGAPSFVQQQPTRNDVVQQVVNSVVEGLIEATSSQLGQTLFQGALGN